MIKKSMQKIQTNCSLTACVWSNYMNDNYTYMCRYNLRMFMHVCASATHGTSSFLVFKIFKCICFLMHSLCSSIFVYSVSINVSRASTCIESIVYKMCNRTPILLVQRSDRKPGLFPLQLPKQQCSDIYIHHLPASRCDTHIPSTVH